MQSTSGQDFAAVLNEAIKARGLSLERIRRRLELEGIHVSSASLSYWQNGRSQPSRAHSGKVLQALERILELEPGHLTSAAPVTATRRRPLNHAAMVAMPGTVEEALGQAGMSRNELRVMSTHLTAVIGEDRTQTSEVVRKVVQCVVAGTRSFPVVVGTSEDENGDGWEEVFGLSSCVAGRRIVVGDSGVAVTEMLLPRALRQGELLMLEYMTSMGPSTEPCQTVTLASPKLNELVMEVQFADGVVPDAVHACSAPDLTSLQEADATPVPVSDGRAQRVWQDVGAGFTSLQWSW